MELNYADIDLVFFIQTTARQPARVNAVRSAIASTFVKLSETIARIWASQAARVQLIASICVCARTDATALRVRCRKPCVTT